MLEPQRSLLAAVTALFPLALLLTGCQPSAEDLYAGDLPERVDFNFHVKPILSDRCFACHGPDEGARKAELRLDTEQGARTVVRAGSLRGSELFRRITSTDPGEVMPPRDSHLTLSDYEKAVLARWIEQGAEWKRHWSFIPPEKPALPRVRDASWVRGPVDRFILARLEREGLKPSPEADRARLIRRVTYDLTGLPPTVEEVDRFLADRSPDAYEKVVDRLLASPAYGERMASGWLDLARYADSHGYHDDGIRYMWPWRDWVIQAFNGNLSYDRFVTWQLAGDLLPNATREQILATGFNRNHPQSAEGGIVDEEFRVEYVADRVTTVGRGLMGLSMDCSRCHDHKYDPITQKDYYRIFAFFNNNNEIGTSPIDGNGGPTLLLPDTAEERRLAAARARVREQEEALREYVARLEREGSFLRGLTGARPGSPPGLVGRFPLDAIVDGSVANLADQRRSARVEREPEIVPGKVAGALKVGGGGYAKAAASYPFERSDPFSLSVWAHPTQRRPYSPILNRTNQSVEYFRGYELALLEDRLSASLIHSWPADAIRVMTREPVPLNAWTHLAVTYDGSSTAAGLRLYVNGRLAPTDVVVDNLRRTIVVPHLAFRIGAKEGTDHTPFEGGLIDEVRIYNRTLAPPEVAQLAGRDAFAELRARAPGQWSEEQRADLLAYHLQTRDGEFSRRSEALRRARSEENQLLSAVQDVMVMQELEQPRATHVLKRGAYDAPGERVQPGTPTSVLAFPDTLPRNRLGLARWLFDPMNPLTARVAVNRHWQMLFGTGLVKTSDDFGNQGEIPTHPELLDWLAVTYRESGWDTKALLKQLVMSATYRQSSRMSPELQEKDPENRLLARGASHRLAAEMIRDGALAASGLLVHKVGGPSVKPYQPEGLWEEKSAGRGALAKFVQDHGESLYRRSLYTLWKRSSPPPMLLNFDAPEREVCILRRGRTNTPPQALGLLNDPQFVEAARLLAERMVREGGAEADGRLRFGFRVVTSRWPSAPELRLLRSLYDKERAHFAQSRAGALALLGVGEQKRDAKLAPDEVAAYTVVANTLLNLDEAVTRR